MFHNSKLHYSWFCDIHLPMVLQNLNSIRLIHMIIWEYLKRTFVQMTESILKTVVKKISAIIFNLFSISIQLQQLLLSATYHYHCFNNKLHHHRPTFYTFVNKIKNKYIFLLIYARWLSMLSNVLCIWFRFCPIINSILIDSMYFYFTRCLHMPKVWSIGNTESKLATTFCIVTWMLPKKGMIIF